MFTMLVILLATGISLLAQQKINVKGKWEMAVETNAGSGNPVFELKHVSDTKLEGTYTGRLGDADVKGMLEGNKIHLEFFVSDMQVEYDGTVDGDTMKGKVKLGNMGEGTFTGKRKK